MLQTSKTRLCIRSLPSCSQILRYWHILLFLFQAKETEAISQTKKEDDQLGLKSILKKSEQKPDWTESLSPRENLDVLFAPKKFMADRRCFEGTFFKRNLVFSVLYRETVWRVTSFRYCYYYGTKWRSGLILSWITDNGGLIISVSFSVRIYNSLMHSLLSVLINFYCEIKE